MTTFCFGVFVNKSLADPLISIMYFLFDVVQTEENDCLLGISPSFSQVFLPKMKFDVRQVSQHKSSLQFLFNSNLLASAGHLIGVAEERTSVPY
jgi:hypothetical protein